MDRRTLLAAGFVIVLTSLPASEWSTREVLELYGFRWQVEMQIKRMKSLLALDGLRAEDPDLAQAYLLGKIPGVLLLEETIDWIYSRAPAGWNRRACSISTWRMMSLCWEMLKEQVRQRVNPENISAALPELARFLADEPRKRPSQLAAAQALLQARATC